MDNNTSILQQVEIDSSGTELIKSSGKWAKFIGIVFIVMAALFLLMGIAIFANIDLLTERMMDYGRMSDQALAFIAGGGKYLFVLLLLIIIGVFVVNAVYLIRFRNASENYFLTGNEDELGASFENLSKYFLITTILGVASTIISFIAVIVTFNFS